MSISTHEELGSPGERDWRRKKAYLNELATQLHSAADAYAEISEAGPIDIDLCYRRAHAFLIHAAGASRILCPVGKDASRISRGKMLRGLLNLPDEHSL